MKINKISNTGIYNTPNTSFRAYMPETFYRCAEKKTIQAEFLMRKAANKISEILVKVTTAAVIAKQKMSTLRPELFKENTLSIKKYLAMIPVFFSVLRDKNDKNMFINAEAVSKIDTNSPEYMWLNYTLSRFMTGGKEVEINIENNELKDIAESGESCIFIMNHDKQKEDPKLLNFFMALLNREYIYNDKSKTCPRPKIILNRDIVDSSSKEKQILAEKWGAVGVDASIHCTNHIYNGKAMSQLVKGLKDDKINLFIFPEGRMCTFSKMDPQWKFQSGIGDIIKNLAARKERVKVVPLGFAYKKDTGAIHIGKPLYFKKDGDKFLFTAGTVNPKYQDKKYTDFVVQEGDQYHEIIDEGVPVPQKELKNYVSGILCENLTACKHLAAESIKNVGTAKDSDTIYAISEKFDENFTK